MPISSNVPLKDQPFLKGLSAEQMAYLESVCRVEEIPKGESLFETGKRAEGFFIVKSGKFDLLLYTPERGPQAIEMVRPGGLLGYSWILPAKMWQYDCKAVVDSSVYSFDGYAIHEKLKKDSELNHALLIRFIGVLADRLNSTRKKMQSLYQAGSFAGPLTIES